MFGKTLSIIIFLYIDKVWNVLLVFWFSDGVYSGDHCELLIVAYLC